MKPVPNVTSARRGNTGKTVGKHVTDVRRGNKRTQLVTTLAHETLARFIAQPLVSSNQSQNSVVKNRKEHSQRPLKRLVKGRVL